MYRYRPLGKLYQILAQRTKPKQHKSRNRDPRTMGVCWDES